MPQPASYRAYIGYPPEYPAVSASANVSPPQCDCVVRTDRNAAEAVRRAVVGAVIGTYDLSPAQLRCNDAGAVGADYAVPEQPRSVGDADTR